MTHVVRATDPKESGNKEPKLPKEELEGSPDAPSNLKGLEWLNPFKKNPDTRRQGQLSGILGWGRNNSHLDNVTFTSDPVRETSLNITIPNPQRLQNPSLVMPGAFDGYYTITYSHTDYHYYVYHKDPYLEGVDSSGKGYFIKISANGEIDAQNTFYGNSHIEQEEVDTLLGEIQTHIDTLK